MKNIESKNLSPNYEIIDIRSQIEYSKGHIYNARNIDMNKLLNEHDKYLDKGKTYYIYCSFGNKSKKVCEMLTLLGYDVINVYGGYDSFK